MSIHVYHASSLAEFYDKFISASELLTENERKEGIKRVNDKLIWSRGQSSSRYSLLPSLLRNLSRITGDKKAYLKLVESFSMQHFSAMTNHINDSQHGNIIDRNEVMQHYGVSTRYLDWTERVETALGFALQNHILFTDKMAESIEPPTVWVLAPSLLNYKVFEQIARTFGTSEFELIAEELGEEVVRNAREILSKSFKDDFKRSVEELLYIQDYKYTNIISLSAISDQRLAAGDRLYGLLHSKAFNPFLYTALRLFGDGIVIDKAILPLAVVQPSHNDRIVAQRGVFTVFPANSSPVELDGFAECEDCLCRIELDAAFDIADQLKTAGFRLADLYPDMGTFSKAINSGI